MTDRDAALFRATLKEEILEAWRTLKDQHPSEHFYSFGQDIGACAECFLITASTEEGLSRVADRYAEMYRADPDECRIALRWSPSDSPLQDSEQVVLSRARALHDAGPDPYDESPEADAWFELVFDAAVRGLADLDRAGAFGTELERANLVLSIWGDQDTEERVGFARTLNTPAVAVRFARELEDGKRTFEQIASRRGTR